MTNILIWYKKLIKNQLNIFFSFFSTILLVLHRNFFNFPSQKTHDMSNSFQEIDLTYLESIADGDVEIIKELITIFLEQVPEFTDGLDSYLSKKDWKGIAALAHKAKSSVISMGMNTLGNTDLKNLELVAKQFRINELKQIKNPDSREQEELSQLTRGLESYPKQRQDWVKENANEETVVSIINRFNKTCQTACKELKTVLERN